MKKKQKRFYSNDKRDQKWTEPEVGRPIDFADKYIEPRTQAGQAELDRERRKKGPAFQKTRWCAGCFWCCWGWRCCMWAIF